MSSKSRKPKNTVFVTTGLIKEVQIHQDSNRDSYNYGPKVVRVTVKRPATAEELLSSGSPEKLAHLMINGVEESYTSRPAGDDAFDPAIGTALAIAYAVFGSKTKFHEFVKSLSK